MDFLQILIVCATSLAVAAISVRLFYYSQTQTPQLQPTIDDETRFLFEGPNLLNATESAEALLSPPDRHKSDWAQLAALLKPRFPTFPAVPPEPLQTSMMIDSADLGSQSQVALESIRGMTRVKLLEQRDYQPTPASNLHLQRMWDSRLETLRSAVQGSPYPIWQSNAAGAITWSNSAYEMLVAACLGPNQSGTSALFESEEGDQLTSAKRRMSLTLRDGSEQLWYDVVSVVMGDTTMHYATDINAVVQAGIAQKNFVQTLTKTFAQLSIGLAIFDRKRELALFNPALADLTEMPVEFLSKRPDLHSFFDKLRDAQMMPEPKNYKFWREELSDLVDAAHNGNYLETWNLPSGLIYQVSGRPHPDGAVAFLFEDISAGISLTRRFRSDLELNQNVLNHLSNAIAVFSPNGSLHFYNDAYQILWGSNGDMDLSETTLQDAGRHWISRSEPTEHWNDILQLAQRRTNDGDCADVVTLQDGRDLTVRANRLPGGAIMIAFEDMHRSKVLSQIVHAV